MSQLNDFNSARLADGFDQTAYFADVANQNKLILRGYIEDVENIEETSIEGLVDYQNQAIANSQTNASVALKRFSNILTNLALMAAVELGVYLTNKLFEQIEFMPQHKEKIAKLAKEAKSAFDDALGENLNNQDAVIEMADDFKKLAAGVSHTGENLSLTNDQYATYQTYVEKLIDINPSLVKGLNAQKDAFIDNANAIELTIKGLKEEQRLMYAQFFNGKDDIAVLEDLGNEYDKVKSKLTTLTLGGIEGTKQEETLLGTVQLLKDNLNNLMNDYKKEGNSEYKRVEELIEKSGLNVSNEEIFHSYIEIAERINSLQSDYDDVLSRVSDRSSKSFKERVSDIRMLVANNENCECGCHYGRSTFEHNYISIEHCYLKRIFNSVKRFNEPQ